MYQIIINPVSKSGKGLKIWKEQVEPALLRNQIPFQSHFSQQPGDVARIAGEITENSSDFPIQLIVLGGDGTVNEALQGISDCSKVVLGYIPTGSSNDLARDLAIPKDPVAAIDIILYSGREQVMDLGTVSYPDGQRRRFAVSCGIGYDAAVCEEALRSKWKKVLNKIGLGKLTYLSIALKQLIRAESVSGQIILDDQEPIEIKNMLYTASMLHRYEGGGFMFSPDADYCDGILNLCAVGDISHGKVLLALPTAFKGKHYRFEGITPYQAKKVTINASSPLWVHTDGEVTRKSNSVTITCEPAAIRMIVPK